MASRVRPLLHAPAVRIDSASRSDVACLVIADLHLGLGATPERPEGPPEGSARTLARQLLELAGHEHAAGLVIAGDVKHPIVGTPPWLRPVVFDFFAELLGGGLSVEVVLGNHDVGLVRHLPKEVEVAPTSGTVRNGVGVFHGHRWPSQRVLDCATLLAGHLHPGYRFAPSPTHPDGKQRCWVRVELPPPSRPGRSEQRSSHVLRSRELIVLPAFHPLAGAESLNRERPARGRSFLYGRFLARGTARAYLLDGTDLGVLPTANRRDAEARARAPPRS